MGRFANRSSSVVLRVIAVSALGAVLWTLGCGGGDSQLDQFVVPGDSGQPHDDGATGADAAEDSSLGDAHSDVVVVTDASLDPVDAGDAGPDVSTDGASDAADGSLDGADPDAEPPEDAGDDGAPCSQKPEECNGVDDNCNGVKDEGDPGGGVDCSVPGKLGECALGTTHCTSGSIKCIANLPASMEICDGKDNDCDGQIDDSPVDTGASCNTQQPGICAAGTQKCVNGELQCVSNLQPGNETCNGLDDDCNGTVDDGFPGAGQPCTVQGQNPNTPCAQGQTNCLSGQNNCTQTVFPSSELCDGKDNDCNGTIDDPLVVNGLVCDTAFPGICAKGKTQCSGGTSTCIPDVQPNTQTETCNSKDDDCDGLVDDVANIKLECASKFTSALNVLDWACTVGNCAIASCLGAFKDCDGNPNNGCEVNSATDVNQCGMCGKTCSSLNGVATCVGGQCQIACNAGFGNCDSSADNGCETPLSNNVSNCGSCGKVCESSTGTPSCSNGACSISCAAGLGNCDNNPDNGCETSLTNDPLHCGSCVTVCSSAGGTPSCSGSQCSIVCNAGYGNCNLQASDGCEANLLTNPLHCGSCASACSGANGTPSCSAGQCAISCSSGWGNCDNNAANGCETSLNQSSNCGACGQTCTNPNGTTTCTGGACVPSCASSWGNCDGNAANGCETSLKTLSDCGACGKGCDHNNATSSCTTGTCTLSSCNTGWGNCDGQAANGCEVNTNTSTAHCGGCGQACSAANGTASCSSGTCSISCSAGWGNCDGNVSNGCEANLTNSVQTCGSCTKVCSFANASANCVSSVCALGTCNSGWGNCDGQATNGCETQLNTNSHCGACGAVCSLSNATSNCSSGSCAVSTCNAGFGNCDGQAANGCEASLNSVGNCGACGVSCALPNATTTCSSGTCAIASCNAGWGNCDGNAANGCETALTSISNCGACGLLCANSHGTTACTSGICSPSCSSGWGNCDGNGANGCETALTSLSNCGACGAVCSLANATGSCSTGTCVISSCSSGWANCNGATTDGCEASLSSVSSCGSCTNACTNAHGTTACTSGACAPVCSSGWGNCDSNLSNGCETSLTTTSNCGGCGVSCALANASTSCSSGSCAIASCNAGWGNCDGNPANGCETQLTSLTNCGACATACSRANATATCSTGSCQIASCNAGWGNCDGNGANGCETQLNSNSNCGACGSTCALANATATCSSGTCAISSCNAGWGNCDGNAANGCETQLNSNSNCGACGATCVRANATTSCSTGSCQITSCNAGWGNCDGNAANGCEVNTQTTLAHCGGCSMPCSTANGSASCSLGACSISCNANYGNCDGNARSNGCEAYLPTDPYNCGTCGKNCGGQTCAGGVCGCVPTGARAPFNTTALNTTAGCWNTSPCAQNNYSWNTVGVNFTAFGESIQCSGAATCVSNVGITTYEWAGSVCQGLWNVYCDGTYLGQINTLGKGCGGSAMSNTCKLSFPAKQCSSIRLEAAPDGDATRGCCAFEYDPDSMITAISAW